MKKHKKNKRPVSEYKIQAICMTRSAACEAVARAIIDSAVKGKAVAEISRDVVTRLGFK